MSRPKLIKLYLALTLILLLGLRSFYVKNPVIEGETMGTAYRVTIGGYVSRSARDELHQRIEDELAAINLQMSTWDEQSEISRFNASAGTNAFIASPDFAEVVTRALEFADSSSGAFDPTLQPLLNLWGFGSEGAEENQVPTEEEILAVLGYTGADLVWIEDTTNLWKALPEVQLDLGAIAKGHGVDRIGQLLEASAFQNWFVEIGGEVAVRGKNPAGESWRVGIQYPSSNLAVDQLQGILHVTNGAVATSGDYRNFIEQDGKLYSHIIEPWTGEAVLTNTASVTVYAPDCLDADAAATALFVLGAEEGLVWVEAHPEAEALFLVRSESGEIEEQFSSGFMEATGYVPVNQTEE